MEHKDLIKEIESTRDNFHEAFMKKDWVRITEQIVHDDSIKFYNDAISLITNIANRHEVLVSQAASQAAQKPEDLKHVICPQCGKPFKLDWNGYGKNPMTLTLRGCPSGGIYDVSIHCPHCDYEEEL